MTIEEVALGFVQVANEAMCRPIRALTQVTHAITDDDSLMQHENVFFYLIISRMQC